LPVWLDITAKEIFEFSPILADKVSVSVKHDEIDKVISQVLSITKSEIIGKDLVKKKIDFLNNCSDDERKKYLIDTEARIKNLVYFEEAYYNWFCSDDAFGDEEWDDFLAEKKRYELQNTYNLPYNVTYNPEFEPGYDMNLIIRLAKRWILKKATVEEINELVFLVDWYHELDLPYILWGFTDESLEDYETRDLCFMGAYQIKSSKKITTSKQIENAAKKVFSRYYG
jgi:hypothetical protein